MNGEAIVRDSGAGLCWLGIIVATTCDPWIL